MALTLLQNAAPASAQTILRATVSEQCPPRVACLWVDGKGGSGLMAMITSPQGKPDMRDNRMRGLTAQFTDDISVGHNGLPFDLCLYDSQNIAGSQWATMRDLVVPSGTDFAQLDDYNDIFDHYTTADPGQCPHHVLFDSITGYIYSSRQPS
ncbi:MAG TPA: hypothetical protein VI248_26315 [Kineosporiaceae bacterium]